MKFWDRQKEVEALKALFMSEPNAITFLYGPKSSGKTTTIKKAVEEIKNEKKLLFFESFRIFWFDLRGIAISTYDSLLDFMFVEKDRFVEEEIERERTKSGIEPMIAVETEVVRRIRKKGLTPSSGLRGS